MKKLIPILILLFLAHFGNSQNDTRAALAELDRQYNIAKYKIQQENDYQTAQGLLQNLNAQYINAKNNIINSSRSSYNQNNTQEALRQLDLQYNQAKRKILDENDYQTAQGLLQNLNAQYINAKNNILSNSRRY
jgi:hypothetical protein